MVASLCSLPAKHAGMLLYRTVQNLLWASWKSYTNESDSSNVPAVSTAQLRCVFNAWTDPQSAQPMVSSAGAASADNDAVRIAVHMPSLRICLCTGF